MFECCCAVLMLVPQALRQGKAPWQPLLTVVWVLQTRMFQLREKTRGESWFVEVHKTLISNGIEMSSLIWLLLGNICSIPKSICLSLQYGSLSEHLVMFSR